MPSHNTYHLTWVSLTLGVGYLFTAAPAKRSYSSLPWMRVLLMAAPPDPECEVAPLALLGPCSCHSLDMGLLLSAAATVQLVPIITMKVYRVFT